MAVTAKFTKGSRTLDVASAPYAVDFVPPSVAPVYSYAEGTSANRSGGASLVGVKYTNREMTVSVRILGTSEAQIREAANRLVRFTQAYGDPSEPLFFEFKPNTLPEPSWGQLGAMLRYEVVGCTAAVQDIYNWDVVRSQGYRVVLSLVVKPFALGAEQALCAAAGGVQEDTVGAVDGLSRGLVVPTAGTNLFLNSIYGNATYSTGWVSAGGVATSQNTDPDYYLFGTCSVHVWGTAATNQVYKGTVTAGATTPFTMSYYAKRPDGSAVTAADTQIFYGVNKTSAYGSVGNGWYRVTWTGAGTAAATDAGASVYTDLYVDGFQFEAGSIPTALMHGDLLGHAFSGVAHNSTSVRTAGTVKLPQAGVLSSGQGAIGLVWTPSAGITAISSLPTMFKNDAGTLQLALSNSTSGFNFSAGTGALTGGSVAIGAGTPVVLHASWGPSGIALYVNGARDGTTGYGPQTQGTNLSLGCNVTASNNSGGVISAFTVYPRELGSAEVASIYTAILPMVSAGKRIDYLPWLWTRDGDNILDNFWDNTYSNIAVANGIPGSDDAQTDFKLTKADNFGTSLWIGRRVDYPEYHRPEQYLTEFADLSDASCSDGTYGTKTAAAGWFNESGIVGSELSYIYDPVHVTYNSMHFFGVMRANTTAATITVYPYLMANNGFTFGEAKTFALDTTYRLYYLGAVGVTPIKLMPLEDNRYISPGIEGTISGDTVRFDYLMYTGGNLAMITPRPNVLGFGTALLTSTMYLRGKKVEYDRSGYTPDLRGDSIELSPNGWNVLQSMYANHAGTLTGSLNFTYSYVKVRPRWMLF